MHVRETEKERDVICQRFQQSEKLHQLDTQPLWTKPASHMGFRVNAETGTRDLVLVLYYPVRHTLSNSAWFCFFKKKLG